MTSVRAKEFDNQLTRGRTPATNSDLARQLAEALPIQLKLRALRDTSGRSIPQKSDATAPVLPTRTQFVHYERLPTRLQWSKLCGTIHIIECISKRDIRGRGGHHSVKMVTGVWPLQMIRCVMERMRMPHKAVNLFNGIIAEPWNSFSAPTGRLGWVTRG